VNNESANGRPNYSHVPPGWDPSGYPGGCPQDSVELLRQRVIARKTYPMGLAGGIQNVTKFDQIDWRTKGGTDPDQSIYTGTPTPGRCQALSWAYTTRADGAVLRDAFCLAHRAEDVRWNDLDQFNGKPFLQETWVGDQKVAATYHGDPQTGWLYIAFE